MIVRIGRPLYSMNGVSWIIILFSIVSVIERPPYDWGIEAWRMTTPTSCKRAFEIPKSIWGSIERWEDSQYHLHELRSMKVPHETNMHHDVNIPTDVRNITNFKVRDCTHGELNVVADIIMDSFYDYTDPGSVWKQLTKLAELNRIQQNFPYGADRVHHRMMVVTVTNQDTSDIATTICGFVDIDTRTPNRPTSYKFNPRPYLSDLCIHPNYRRYGLASLLIQSCEDYCRSHHSSKQRNDSLLNNHHLGPEIYIRVETKNTIAIQMYEKLGYATLSGHADSNNKNILILYKAL
jgi:ribosomal protein S18 acetylase RimI-like enzyme